MSDHCLTVHAGGEEKNIYSDGAKSLLSVLREAGFSAPDAPCGGHGTCGKCRVFVRGMVRMDRICEVSGEVCACTAYPAGDLEIFLTDTADAEAENTAPAGIAGGSEGYGLAVDLGTTTVSAALYDLASGKRSGINTHPNAQRAYGADVVSRIEFCRKGDMQTLFNLTSRQLASFCPEPERVTQCVIVGNTVMEHFAAGLDPSPLAVPPFQAQSLFGDVRTLAAFPKARSYFTRCAGAYVGGDVLAGMMACDLDNADGLRLYVDIGTNGEICMGNHECFSVCATAAGPAFEGAEISCGMRAAQGAIDRVSVENGDLRLHVLGDCAPKGICGSGLIDACAALLELRLIGPSGRFINRDKAPEQLRWRFTAVNGVRAFSLCEGVALTSDDIHALLLAKAAIRAGIETLLNGRQPDSITVAGGFGNYLSIPNAVRIGLLPSGCEVRQVGNSAFRGAIMLLADENRARLQALSEKCSYVELSSSEQFYQNYLSMLRF